jgi:glycosyltransferase involved in cell wall biosynthesis
MDVVLINTFKPVVPLFDLLIPELKRRGFHARAVTGNVNYRDQSVLHRPAGDPDLKHIHIPRLFRKCKLLHSLVFAIGTTAFLLRTRCRLVVFLTQPPLYYLIGGMLCVLKKTPFCIHVMDLYPDLFLPMGFLKKRRRNAGPLFWLAGHVFRHASKVIVIGRCMGRRVQSYGVPSSRLALITNAAHENRRLPTLNYQAFRKQHNLENKFIVMYSGNMGQSHIFSTLLDVAHDMNHTDRDVLFVFIGRGSRRSEIQERVGRLDNLRLLDYQPQTHLPFVLSLADLHFLSLREGFEGLVVPSKFYGILQSGKPSLFEGHVDSEIAQVIREYRCGIVVPPRDRESLMQAIRNYKAHVAQRRLAGRNAQTAYHEMFRQDIMVARYSGLIENLLAPSSASLSPQENNTAPT